MQIYANILPKNNIYDQIQSKTKKRANMFFLFTYTSRDQILAF